MARSFTFLAMFATVLVGLPIAAVAQNDEPDQKREEASPSEWLRQRQAEFEEYRFEVEAPKPLELTMESRSILNWSNAERGADVGGVFLWTKGGLPQLIACAFGRGKFLRHEFHSLSTEPIAAERSGAAIHRFQRKL